MWRPFAVSPLAAKDTNKILNGPSISEAVPPPRSHHLKTYDKLWTGTSTNLGQLEKRKGICQSGKRLRRMAKMTIKTNFDDNLAPGLAQRKEAKLLNAKVAKCQKECEANRTKEWAKGKRSGADWKKRLNETHTHTHKLECACTYTLHRSMSVFVQKRFYNAQPHTHTHALTMHVCVKSEETTLQYTYAHTHTCCAPSRSLSHSLLTLLSIAGRGLHRHGNLATCRQVLNEWAALPFYALHCCCPV